VRLYRVVVSAKLGYLKQTRKISEVRNRELSLPWIRARDCSENPFTFFFKK
jgi:hypothetical protein